MLSHQQFINSESLLISVGSTASKAASTVQYSVLSLINFWSSEAKLFCNVKKYINFIYNIVRYIELEFIYYGDIY